MTQQPPSTDEGFGADSSQLKLGWKPLLVRAREWGGYNPRSPSRMTGT